MSMRELLLKWLSFSDLHWVPSAVQDYSMISASFATVPLIAPISITFLALWTISILLPPWINSHCLLRASYVNASQSLLGNSNMALLLKNKEKKHTTFNRKTVFAFKLSVELIA